MSDKPEDWDRSRDEIISGEYVLGVLSAEDRRRVEARMAVDKRFAQQVRRWQANLSGFNDDDEAVRPPPLLYNRLERRLFAMDRKRVGALRQLWGSVAAWRIVAAASLLVAVSLVLYQLTDVLPDDTERPLVAELAGPQDGAFNLIAAFNAETGRMTVVPVALKQPEPKSLELWIIEDGKPPQSLGLLPDNGNGEIVIEADKRRFFAEGRTIAITVEPFGGAPDGKPTGPIVASGRTRLL
ncbi:anti-sigma factor [Rhizobium sp.]